MRAAVYYGPNKVSVEDVAIPAPGPGQVQLQVGFNGPYQVDENNDSVSVYDAFLGAPRTYGATLRMRY